MKNWQRWYTTWVTVKMTPFGVIRHLCVEKRNGNDGITWDVLQQIKNDVLGQDVAAMEIYPPADRVVNELNRRHLWEIPPEMMPAW